METIIRWREAPCEHAIHEEVDQDTITSKKTWTIFEYRIMSLQIEGSLKMESLSQQGIFA